MVISTRRIDLIDVHHCMFCHYPVGSSNRQVTDSPRTCLRGIEREVSSTPIELDPRMAALAALEAAQGGLCASRTAVGAFGDINPFVTLNGIGSVLNVRAANFNLALSAVSGSRIQLGFTLVT